MPGAGFSLSVVIMAFNEERNLPHLLPEVKRYLDGRPLRDWEIIVVDDGSTDGTAAVVTAAAAGEPRLRLVRHDRNRGMGAAIRTGYREARMEFVTQLPADCQIPPETLDLFLPHLPATDLVLSVYSNRGDTLLRRFLAGGYRAVAAILLGQRADYTGTMVFRRALLDGIDLGSDSFVVNLEFPLKALAAGASSQLVFFRPAPRRSGRSKILSVRRLLFVTRELIALRGRLQRAEVNKSFSRRS